jgi:hypothetical protein
MDIFANTGEVSKEIEQIEQEKKVGRESIVSGNGKLEMAK